MTLRWFITLLFLCSTFTVIGTQIPSFFGGASLAKPTTAPATIIQPLAQVYIGGGVKKPGIYQLPKGAMIYQAVQHAGGLSEQAIVDPKYLAKRLPQNGHVLIPMHTPPPSEAAKTPEQKEGKKKKSKKSKKNNKNQAPKGPVNINQATAKELQRIKGIGPQLAKRILKVRQKQGFQTANDLLKVPGIGPKTLKKIERYIEL